MYDCISFDAGGGKKPQKNTKKIVTQLTKEPTNRLKMLTSRIKTPSNRVKQKIARLIHSANYPKDTTLLGFNNKIMLLEKLTALNQQTKVNSVHVSLNFDASDTLNDELLKQIADAYMQKIGFGEQPYLVYQHNDAGHPHIHIVTTNIKRDGKRIELHNLARNQSMKASMQIEKDFNLVKALSKSRLNYELKPVNAQRAQYGKAETKRAITNVLDHVLSTYKYTSLAELNAVLRLYNIVADRGDESPRIFQHKGLIYRILDSDGKKIGVPVKASLIYNKPTLKTIEAKFELNESGRQKYKQRVMNAIDLALLKRSRPSLQELIQAVQKEKIQVVLRQNDKGFIYGVTYIDHHTKCVFNGSHLGKQYSAAGLQQRCNYDKKITQTEQAKQSFEDDKTTKSPNGQRLSYPDTILNQNTGASTILQPISALVDGLLQPEENRSANEPFEQKRFKKKRKRKQKHKHN